MAENWSGTLESTQSFIANGSNNTITVQGTKGQYENGRMLIAATSINENIFENNKVIINGGEFSTKFVALGTTAGSGNKINNQIRDNLFIVNGGKYNTIRLIQHTTGVNSGQDVISGNKAYITGGSVSNTFLVFDNNRTDGTANLQDNYVEISGGNFKQVLANNSAGGDITDNTFIITGGDFKGLVSPGKTGTGSVENNRLEISGGTFSGDIAGGVAGKDSGITNNNTVVLSGTANIAQASLFGGGYTQGTGSGSTLETDKVEAKYLKGNKLIIDYWRGSAENIYNLEVIDVYAKNDVHNGTVILDLTGSASHKQWNTTLGDTEGHGTTVNLAYVQAGAKLNAGDRIHLLRNQNGIDGVLTNAAEVKQGVSLIYDGVIEQLEKSVDFHITGVRATEESASITEGALPGLELLNAGSDLLSRLLSKEHLLGKHVFGIASGGHMNYKTDSSSSFAMDSLNIITGANYAWSMGKDIMEAGAFFEAGWGNAAMATDVTHDTLDGRGDIHYYGGGLLARYEKKEGALKGLHFDASARMGSVYTSYSSDDLRSPETNQAASYDISPTYYALHGGIGYAFPLNDTWTVDIVERYFWTKLSDSEMTVLGDTYKLDELASNRLRTSVKFNYMGNKDVSPYIRLGYDYEFDGTASGTVQGVPIRNTSLRGGTGIGEFGFSSRPEWDENWSVDASVALYAGQQTGVMGNIRVMYEF